MRRLKYVNTDYPARRRRDGRTLVSHSFATELAASRLHSYPLKLHHRGSLSIF